jgi:hypothetical protein
MSEQGTKPDARKGVVDRGVKILSGKPGEQGGVEQLSRREPGELQTQVEVAEQPRHLDEDGKLKYRRII